MLFQPSNVIPSSLAGTGKGVINVNDNVSISFQLNGSSNLEGFAFVIYPNTGNAETDAEPVYRSEKITVSPSIPPRTATGEPQTYLYHPLSTTWEDLGLDNGVEYKYEIIQFFSPNTALTKLFASDQAALQVMSVKYNGIYYWYYILLPSVWRYIEFDARTLGIMIFDANNKPYIYASIGTRTSAAGTVFDTATADDTNYGWVRQYSPNAIVTREAPTLSISPLSIAAPNVTFSGTFSQAEGDTVVSARWMIYHGNTIDENTKPIADTGWIDTSELEYYYKGFIYGEDYTIRLDVRTSSGIERSELSNDIQATYLKVDDLNVTATAQQDGGIRVGLPSEYTLQDYLYYDVFAVYADGRIRRIASTQGTYYLDDIIDYTSRAGDVVTYKLLAADYGDVQTIHIGNSGQFCMRYNAYSLYVTHPDDNEPNGFVVDEVIFFGNNISSSAISNNNSPEWLENFTGYRFRQQTARKGKSGTLSALISNVDDMNDYNDTVEQMEKLYALSQTDKTLFLKDMKGNMYMIAVAAPITQQINTASGKQEVTISLPWEEIGNCDNVSLYRYAERQEA